MVHIRFIDIMIKKKYIYICLFVFLYIRLGALVSRSQTVCIEIA